MIQQYDIIYLLKMEKSRIKIEDLNEKTKNGIEKTIWRNILIHLKFSRLKKMAQVCKELFCILSEDEIFWKMYVLKKQKKQAMDLPEGFKSWKGYHFEREMKFVNYWRESKREKWILRFNLNIDSVSHIKITEFEWEYRKSKKPILTGRLYCFELRRMENLNFALGITTEREIRLSHSFFGNGDTVRGFIQLDSQLFNLSNIEGDQLPIKNLIPVNSKIYFLIQNGSVDILSSHTITFFLQLPDSQEIRVLYTLSDLFISFDENLYAFYFCIPQQHKIKFCNSIPDGKNYLIKRKSQTLGN